MNLYNSNVIASLNLSKLWNIKHIRGVLQMLLCYSSFLIVAYFILALGGGERNVHFFTQSSLKERS